MSSKYRIVTEKIRLSLRKNSTRTTTTIHYDWILLDNRDIRDKYAIALSNQFDAIQEKTKIHAPNDEYENFVHAKLEATLIFVDFTKAFDSIQRGRMEQILLAYGIPKETVAAITILYRNTKVKVRSPHVDTEYFDIEAGVPQGDTLAPYLFIICLDYVLRTSIDKIKENGFELTKKRSRRYPAKTITDADYADDIAILANTPDQAETLLHSLERAAASIGLYVNGHKTEYI